MTKVNKAGFLRKGFDFQDSYGLLLCSEWLMSPDKYKALHFELVPDDAGKNFTLDDIALVDGSGKKRLYQAKYKDDPSYVWNFEDLTAIEVTRAGKTKPSLLQKWADSVKNTEGLAYAALVSNAQANSTRALPTLAPAASFSLAMTPALSSKVIMGAPMSPRDGDESVGP